MTINDTEVYINCEIARFKNNVVVHTTSYFSKEEKELFLTIDRFGLASRYSTPDGVVKYSDFIDDPAFIECLNTLKKAFSE